MLTFTGRRGRLSHVPQDDQRDELGLRRGREERANWRRDAWSAATILCWTGPASDRPAGYSIEDVYAAGAARVLIPCLQITSDFGKPAMMSSIAPYNEAWPKRIPARAGCN